MMCMYTYVPNLVVRYVAIACGTRLSVSCSVEYYDLIVLFYHLQPRPPVVHRITSIKQ